MADGLRCWEPVSWTKARVDDEFWGPRQRVNRERTLPAQWRQCKDTGRVDAFRVGWRPGAEPVPHIFWDSDVAKWLEAASYSLAIHPDPTLQARVDELVDLVVSAQQPDGYLNAYYTVVEPEKRWTNLRDCHELYCAGHLIEAAVAHQQATGSRKLLEALCRYADYIATVFGPEPGKKRGYCGHEEIELALVRLYRATGEARYLRLSEYFVRERGRQPHYFDSEARARGEDPQHYWARTYAYCQAHKPVIEQDEVVGHAVRAMYLYSAMADLAAELNDEHLLAACERLWDDLALRKLYITGGIGPSHHNEGFTWAYDLPNTTAYAETCAAIGLVLWAHRMLQLRCDGRYADAMERALYNGVLSGVSLDGERFFYVNPLASNGDHHRQEWFDCACCPPNLARMIASLGGYAYARGSDGVAVHLYLGGEVGTRLADDTSLRLIQRTRYPWEGSVALTVEPDRPTEFTLRLRIPGWCRRHTLRVNGEPLRACVADGYACVRRTWQAGDRVEVEFDMPVEQVVAHPSVAQDSGRVALQRGPVVYCLEGVDHPGGVHRLALPPDARLRPRFDPGLLGGLVVIEGQAMALDSRVWDRALYLPADAVRSSPVILRAIPYFAWDNREPGDMAVWLWRG